MKKFLLIPAILVSMAGSAQQKPVAKIVTPAMKLITPSDSIQYAIGAYVGLWITTNGLSVGNTALFQKGLDDILQKKNGLISDSMVAVRVAAYQLSVLKNKGIQQEKDLFASLNNIPGVGMFPNGVRYIIYKTGQGVRPGPKDSILVHLIAKLADGTVVEDTYQSKKPFAATTSSFFPGLNDALQMMTQGSRWQLYVPAVQAYGDKSSQLIPPHSALILEVELLSIKPSGS